jgi:hypothetical protein
LRKSAFSTKGYQREQEVFGTYSCPEVAHVGVQSVRKFEIGQVIGISVLKYIMQKEFSVFYRDDTELIWSTIASPNAAPTRITFHGVQTNFTGGVIAGQQGTSSSYSLNAGLTVIDFANWFSTNVFSSSNFGGADSTAANQAELVGYSLGVPDFTAVGVQANRDTPMRDIKDLLINVYSSCELKIQNVTPGNNNGFETTDLGANPLEGRMYVMPGLIPHFQQNSITGSANYAAFFSTAESLSRPGVLLPTIPPVGNAGGIPNPRDFDRCFKSSNVRVMPGQIGTYVVRFKFSGKLNTLITGLAYNATGNPAPSTSFYPKRRMGNVMLVSLEKVVRTGPAPVVIGYHAEWKTGARVVGFSVRTMNKGNASAVDGGTLTVA